ncbi:MAG: hypothetical protein Q4B72_07865 [Lachnospiraceae bacterium]|nr:hypothetical protein [Lachnospiraceae bacterium]
MKEKIWGTLEPDRVLRESKVRKCSLEKMLCEVREKLEMAPEGTIRILERGNEHQYYHRTEKTDTQGRYIRKSEKGLIKALVEKNYLQKLEKELVREIDILYSVIQSYHPDQIDKIYEGLHRNRKTLVTPVRYPDAEYVNKWESYEYEKKGFPEDYPEFYSDRGERVRSKSEIIIANKLLRMKVPYRYECPVRMFDGKMVHPDFICLNVRTRKEYVWEHFGMMDDKDYANQAISKIERYSKSGFWLGVNMIATFESTERPINVYNLKRIIEQYLI